ISPASYLRLKDGAVVYLNSRSAVYVVDGFAGWDPAYRLKVRVICERPYHALFMRNMLIRPQPDELATFGTPDFVIYNAGRARADASIDGVDSTTCVALDLESRELVILGTEYAGEMKKGVFTAMHYLMPRRNVLSMHCSATESLAGDVSLFFGLSGTGKTTLSADPHRQLVGDDEHCWSPDGIFNIEGGCYAKCIKLSEKAEPQIFQAIRFGTVLENTVQDSQTRIVDYNDATLTENTRAAYPIDFIHQAKIPCVAGHPRHIIFLTCDAFGVLPPVSRLSSAQAQYHFLSGYTAKVAGTEVGVTEPTTTFSACFGAAFLVWHPTKYAEMLDELMRAHDAQAWLVNTGWSGGAFGTGKRISLQHTRAIVEAIHSGALARQTFVPDPVFQVEVPLECPGCPSQILVPRQAWNDPTAYDRAARSLARQFHEHFAEYAAEASPAVRDAAPRLELATAS
ncbi:MAG TPA: phosphoenolpyruvate carboxykinase (ATP), partial [Pirellulaceae bacterium]